MKSEHILIRGIVSLSLICSPLASAQPAPLSLPQPTVEPSDVLFVQNRNSKLEYFKCDYAYRRCEPIRGLNQSIISKIRRDWEAKESAELPTVPLSLNEQKQTDNATLKMVGYLILGVLTGVIVTRAVSTSASIFEWTLSDTRVSLLAYASGFVSAITLWVFGTRHQSQNIEGILQTHRQQSKQAFLNVLDQTHRAIQEAIPPGTSKSISIPPWLWAELQQAEAL